MKALATPESSTIKMIEYDELTSRLDVEFKSGGKYIYVNVPEKIYEAFTKAPSKGKFFHANIKDVFDYSKIKK